MCIPSQDHPSDKHLFCRMVEYRRKVRRACMDNMQHPAARRAAIARVWQLRRVAVHRCVGALIVAQAVVARCNVQLDGMASSSGVGGEVGRLRRRHGDVPRADRRGRRAVPRHDAHPRVLSASCPLLPPPSLSAPHALIYGPRAFRARTHAPTQACAHAHTRCDKRMRTHTNARARADNSRKRDALTGLLKRT